MASQPDEVRFTASSSSSAAHYPDGTSSEQIRQDIRRTRREMDETVDAIEERLRPRHLLDDVLEWLRGSGGGSAISGATESFKDAGYKVLDKLKEHPMPAALIGAGLVWMLFEDDSSKVSRRDYEPRKWDVLPHSGSYVDARTGRPYDESYGKESETAQQQPSITEKVSEKVSDAAGKVGEWAGSARESISGATESVRDYALSASDQLQRGYDTSKHYVERGMNEYPLAMGAAAMALGVLTGMFLPRTRTEDRLMGEHSDEIKHRAKEIGRDVVNRGQRIASATVAAASEEASKAGLNPENVVEKVKHVARDAKDAAVDSAKGEGLDPDRLEERGRQVIERIKDEPRDQAQPQKDEFYA